jgi:hypothetical protein
MTDVVPDEDIPPPPPSLPLEGAPSLLVVGGDSEVNSVPSSPEDSSPAQPVDSSGTAPASTTAAESSGSAPSLQEDSSPAQPVDSNETAPASTTAADSSGSASNDTSGSGSTSSKPKPSGVKSRTSFTADSPYFTSFCDGEIKSLHTLTESLGDISARTKTFCRTQALMSEAMHRLANSCKLRPERNKSQEDSDEERPEREDVVLQRRHAVGEEMATLLQLLGEVSQSVSLFLVIILCQSRSRW